MLAFNFYKKTVFTQQQKNVCFIPELEIIRYNIILKTKRINALATEIT